MVLKQAKFPFRCRNYCWTRKGKVISIKMQLPGVYIEILGTSSIDNEMHDDGVRNPRRTGSRVSFSAGKMKVKQSVILRRRRFLVLWLVALLMAFKNVRNLLLINHNDGFIDDDEFVVLYDLYTSRNLDCPYDSYAPFDLEELDESKSFAEFRFGKRDIRIMKEVLQIPDTITCSQRFVCDGLEGLCMLLKRLSYPCRNGDMIHSLCWEIRSAYRSLTALAVTRNSGLFREFNRQRCFPILSLSHCFSVLNCMVRSLQLCQASRHHGLPSMQNTWIYLLSKEHENRFI